MDLSMEDAAGDQSDRKVVKQGFKMDLFNGYHRCGGVRQLKAEGEHERTDRPLCVIQVIRTDGQTLG